VNTGLEDKHLLVVDDDERIRTLLRKYLMRHGFRVTVARDAAHARRVLSGLEFDLIVMDVMMPGEDGFDLTESLRVDGTRTPIVLLTARGETEDRIRGLRAGADDYLAKPFEPTELLLRTNAILRRSLRPEAVRWGPKIIRLGAVHYDTEQGKMWNGKHPVRLTSTEARLMKIFAANPGDPVSRARLIEEPDRDGGTDDRRAQDRAVDVRIGRLRRKIEVDPARPRYLQTVRGAGYMLAPD